MVDRWIFDQIPALIIGGCSGIVEHQRDRLGDIHGGAAADADDAVGCAQVVGSELGGQVIDVVGFRLIIDIDMEHPVAFLQRQSTFEFTSLEDIVEDKNHVGLRGDPFGLEDIA